MNDSVDQHPSTDEVLPFCRDHGWIGPAEIEVEAHEHQRSAVEDSLIEMFTPLQSRQAIESSKPALPELINDFKKITCQETCLAYGQGVKL